MNINLDPGLADGYKSAAQIARVVTEGWATANLFCLICTEESLQPTPTNEPVADFVCVNCAARYQLKSRKKPAARKIRDAAYGPMMQAIRDGTTPNLLVLHYDSEAWRVRDLFAIPSFALTESTIECCRPLRNTARRAGWIGCNILLSQIPVDARIDLVRAGASIPPEQAREAWSKLSPLQNLSLVTRGWALDVLRVVRELGSHCFTLADVYAHEEELRTLHPANRHVRPKIRQQLQVLRDAGLVEFLERGHYGIVPAVTETD